MGTLVRFVVIIGVMFGLVSGLPIAVDPDPVISPLRIKESFDKYDEIGDTSKIIQKESAMEYVEPGKMPDVLLIAGQPTPTLSPFPEDMNMEIVAETTENTSPINYIDSPIDYIQENQGNTNRTIPLPDHTMGGNGRRLKRSTTTTTDYPSDPAYILYHDIVLFKRSTDQIRSKRNTEADVTQEHFKQSNSYIFDDITDESEPTAIKDQQIGSEKNVTCMCTMFMKESLGGHKIPLIAEGISKIQTPLDEESLCVQHCWNITSNVSIALPIWSVSWKMSVKRLNLEDTSDKPSVLSVEAL